MNKIQLNDTTKMNKIEFGKLKKMGLGFPKWIYGIQNAEYKNDFIILQKLQENPKIAILPIYL